MIPQFQNSNIFTCWLVSSEWSKIYNFFLWKNKVLKLEKSYPKCLIYSIIFFSHDLMNGRFGIEMIKCQKLWNNLQEYYQSFTVIRLKVYLLQYKIIIKKLFTAFHVYNFFFNQNQFTILDLFFFYVEWKIIYSAIPSNYHSK